MKPALTLEQLALCGGNLQWDTCMWRQNPSFYLSTYLNKIYVTVRSKSNP